MRSLGARVHDQARFSISSLLVVKRHADEANQFVDQIRAAVAALARDESQVFESDAPRAAFAGRGSSMVLPSGALDGDWFDFDWSVTKAS